MGAVRALGGGGRVQAARAALPGPCVTVSHGQTAACALWANVAARVLCGGDEAVPGACGRSAEEAGRALREAWLGLQAADNAHSRAVIPARPLALRSCVTVSFWCSSDPSPVRAARPWYKFWKVLYIARSTLYLDIVNILGH